MSNSIASTLHINKTACSSPIILWLAVSDYNPKNLLVMTLIERTHYMIFITGVEALRSISSRMRSTKCSNWHAVRYWICQLFKVQIRLCSLIQLPSLFPLLFSWPVSVKSSYITDLIPNLALGFFIKNDSSNSNWLFRLISAFKTRFYHILWSALIKFSQICCCYYFN